MYCYAPTVWIEMPMLKDALRKLSSLLAAAVLIAACTGPEREQLQNVPADAGPVSGLDYHSYANTDDYRTTHIDLDFTVDFDSNARCSSARRGCSWTA